MGQFDRIKKEETVDVNVENSSKENNNQTVESVPAPSAEELKVKEDTKAENKIADQKRIDELKDELINKIENKNEFGESKINNPRILDLIAEIEHCDMTNQEEKEQSIKNWKELVENVYQELIEDYNENIDGTFGMNGDIIYGLGGKDRFVVESDGNVFLQHNPGSRLDAGVSARKRAMELGMEIKEVAENKIK